MALAIALLAGCGAGPARDEPKTAPEERLFISDPPRWSRTQQPGCLEDYPDHHCLGRVFCLIDSGGDLYCSNYSSPPSTPTEWIRIRLPERARDVALVSEGGCALLESGRLACWGFTPVVLALEGPFEVPEPSDMDESGCTLLESGRFDCWSSLPDAPGREGSAPQVVEQPREVEWIWSYRDLCVGTRAGAVNCWCWRWRIAVLERPGVLRYVPPNLEHVVADLGRARVPLPSGCGVCVLDERRRLRCAGEEPDPTIDLPAPLQRGIVDATNAQGHLCAIDDARALWCFEANDYSYPDDLQHRWYRRLDPPVEALFQSGNAFCARRAEDVVCRGIRPQAGLSETPVSDDRPQHPFYAFDRALRPDEELLILDQQLCVRRSSGKLACPEPLARRLGPRWAVERLE